MIRKQYEFEGNVQGVGFRYRCVMAARALGITGWVENQWDGSVLMEAQGEPDALDEMIKRLEQSRFGRIDAVKQIELPVKSNERNFSVR
ncbi:MAG: acylphosphatase [Oscillospiraceae bacterium]|nr:acylphosphatase [Oscillospiraceae bacterium]